MLNINHYKFKWDTVIISRYLNYFLYVKHNSNNTILWIHDTVPNYIYNGKNLYNFGITFYYNIEDKIDKIVCVSEWQKKNFLNIYKQIDKDKITDIPIHSMKD